MTQEEIKFLAVELQRIETMIEFVHQENVEIAKVLCETDEGEQRIEESWNQSFDKIKNWEYE